MYTVNDALWLVAFLQGPTVSFHLVVNVQSADFELVELAFRYELVEFLYGLDL